MPAIHQRGGNSPRSVTVCVLGQHDPEYPRNTCVQRWLTRAGFEVKVCHSKIAPPFRTLSLLAQYLSVWRGVDVVYATEGSHTHIPYLKLLTSLTRKPLIFDPFLSRYNTRVEDRKLFDPGSLQARRAKFQDALACRAADALVFDTHEHHEYFAARYSCDKPCYVLEVGVNEDVFRPTPGEIEKAEPNVTTEVLFYGTYIPLHGIDTILRAAAELKHNPQIRFKLIGAGQTYTEMRGLASQLELGNVEFLGQMPETELATHISRSDICLGVFADGTKPAQVVPNKVVQCAAAQKAIVTRASPAIERYFEDGSSIVLVPKADPLALARAIGDLAQNAPLRSKLGVGARRVFSEHFREEVQVGKIGALVADVLKMGR